MFRIYRIAFWWGFAEATFFFFIPDIYLTRVALTQPRKAYLACLIAALAACLGGAGMYYFGHYNGLAAELFLTLIPGISHLFITHVSEAFQAAPYTTLLFGPIHGIPYKILAVIFGEYRVHFYLFILVSFVARIARFLATTSVSALLAYSLRQKFSLYALYYTHAIIWIIIYCIYFYQMKANYG